MISTFANPHRFMAFSKPLIWPSLIVGLVLIAAGFYWGLFVAPPDFRQGDSARIMFVHVPAAWLALGAYVHMAIASFVALVWRHNLADFAAKAAAPAGAIFTAVNLATGSLWGKPMWGTYWEWDPRLTAMLILLFLYFGYMALWSAIEDKTKAARAAAILCLVGVINVPIIRFSVEWWASLHQGPSVIREGGPAMPLDYLAPLLVTAVGFLCLFAFAVLAGMRAEVYRRRAAALDQRAAATVSSQPAKA